MNLTNDNVQEYINFAFGGFLRFNNILRFLETYHIPRDEGMIVIFLPMSSFLVTYDITAIEELQEQYEFCILRQIGVLYFEDEGAALQYTLTFGVGNNWSNVKIKDIFKLKDMVTW